MPKMFNKCDFITSAADMKDWPETTLNEVVLAGRSNVGKSSFINCLTGRKNLAYVGNTPGKTQLLNFFNIDDEFVIVDVPGYGYAQRHEKQLEAFGKMMEDYFSKRKQVKGLVMIVDARHKPTKDDLNMIEFARYYHFAVKLIVTKMDKLKNSERKKQLALIQNTLEVNSKDMIPFSSISKEGREEAIEAIYSLI